MCTARLFSRGVDLFALKFYVDRVIPINHFWRRNTRDTELPDSEDRIPVRSLVLTQYWSVTDRQTDRRICCSIYSFVACCKNESWSSVRDASPCAVYSSAISCSQCWKFRSMCSWTIWRWWRNTITGTCHITTACTPLTSHSLRTCSAAGPPYEYDNNQLVIIIIIIISIINVNVIVVVVILCASKTETFLGINSVLWSERAI